MDGRLPHDKPGMQVQKLQLLRLESTYDNQEYIAATPNREKNRACLST